METRIQLIIDGDGSTRREIAHWKRDVLAPETLGLKLDEEKALLASSSRRS